eukprot:Lankesteria_metandrocarpae@DN3501_c0_g1_i2.p1
MAAVARPQQVKPTKQKVPKDLEITVPKPNEELFRKSEDELLHKIDELRAQQTALTQKMNGNRGGNGEFGSKIEEVRKQIAVLSKQINGFHGERQSLHGQLGVLQESSRTKRNEVLNMKKGLEFSNESDLEEKLRDLEQYLTSTSMSLKEEKKLVSKIEQLRRMKPDVQKYRNLESSMQEEDSNSVGQIRTKLHFVTEELKRLTASRDEEYRKLKQLQEDRTKATEPLKVLYEERVKVEVELKDKNATLHVLRQENNDLMRDHYQQVSQTRKKKQESERQEKHKADLVRDLERAQENLERVESGGLDIPGLLDLQIMYQYLEKLSTEYKQTALEEASPTGNSDYSPTQADDGEWVKPKNKREDPNTVTSKKQKGKNRKPKKMREITHNIKTLVLFGEMGVEAPETYDDLDNTLQQLKVKLDEKEGSRDEYKLKTQKQKDDCCQKITDLTTKLRLMEAGSHPSSPVAGGRGD